MKIKLQPGDCVNVYGLTATRHIAVFEKFKSAIGKSAVSIIETNKSEYMGWSKCFNDIEYASNPDYVFRFGRFLTIDQVLNSSQEEEDMQEEKYVPKIGEECENKTINSNLWFAITPIFISDIHIMYHAKSFDNNYYEGLIKIELHEFRKIKIEREIFIDEAYQAISDNFKHSDLDQLLVELFDAGFKSPNQ